MRHSVSRAQKGFTLIEFTVVLVGGLILAAAGAAIGKAGYDWLRVWQVDHQLEIVAKAASSRYAQDGIYTTISKDELEQYLPTGFEWTNVLGGDVDVESGTESYNYKITSANLPENIGTRLADKYPDDSVFDTGTGTITLTRQ